MKRTGNLFDRILEWDNLRRAFYQAAKGKRDRPEVCRFAANLEARLRRLREGVADGTFAVGDYRQFVIHDPKERIITAPCLAERVLHHALMNVCGPVFERWLIPDTFACRQGKGRIAAVLRAQDFARRHAYFLKLDIRKYFDSVPHGRLLELLRRRFKDARLLDWFERIVRGFRGDLGVGLPIGSLMSQHFANFYLGWFDRFVKETCHVRGYVRYMDDLAFWADDTPALGKLLQRSQAFLREELGLVLKAEPYRNRTRHGMEYLGCRLFPYHAVLTRRAKRRFRHKLRQLEHGLNEGTLGEQDYQRRSEALVAFTKAAGVRSWTFRRSVLQQLEVKGPKARTG